MCDKDCECGGFDDKYSEKFEINGNYLYHDVVSLQRKVRKIMRDFEEARAAHKKMREDREDNKPQRIRRMTSKPEEAVAEHTRAVDECAASNPPEDGPTATIEDVLTTLQGARRGYLTQIADLRSNNTRLVRRIEALEDEMATLCEEASAARAGAESHKKRADEAEALLKALSVAAERLARPK